MTEIENAGQAIVKSKEYLVNPIGVAQAVVDDDSLYEQYRDPPALRQSTEGEVWVVGWKGNWGNEKFLDIMYIHMRKSDGELVFWRNHHHPDNGDSHGAIGWRISKKYWVNG